MRSFPHLAALAALALAAITPYAAIAGPDPSGLDSRNGTISNPLDANLSAPAARLNQGGDIIVVLQAVTSDVAASPAGLAKAIGASASPSKPAAVGDGHPVGVRHGAPGPVLAFLPEGAPKPQKQKPDTPVPGPSILLSAIPSGSSALLSEPGGRSTIIPPRSRVVNTSSRTGAGPGVEPVLRI